MIQICLATLNSEHFSFEGVGTDEASATEALKAGLRAHAKQYRVAADWFEDQDRYEIQTRFLTVGAAYRDREEI